MSYNKFINNSYCVGVKHYSPTTNIYGDTTNTGIQISRPEHILRGNCVTCNRNKSLIVSERTIDGEGLGDFFKHLGKMGKNVGKKILKNPGRALEIAANIGTAAASKNPRLIAATAPTLLNLFIKGKDCTKPKVCRVKAATQAAKQTKKQELIVKACIWEKSTSYIH